MDTKTYISRIAKKTINVGVVGLGYVGVPLSLSFVRAGLHVTGFELDQAKVRMLLSGESYLHHISDSEIKNALKHNFFATTEFDNIKNCDAIIICVPTPLTRHREPEMKYVISAANSVAAFMRVGQLLVLESTTWPGTTVELLKPIIEKKGLQAGKDFYLAFSPEREDPGNKKYTTSQVPKIVGGIDQNSTEVASALYSAAFEKVVKVSDTRVAEMTKLLENIFRSVNIALVNELKILCQAMDIDIWEVIQAASTKPFGFMPFYPGPGLGGHCIPIDPFYLTWKAREFDQPTRFIELAGQINTAMPHYILERVVYALNDAGKSINGSSVIILGVAYKRDIDDMRESPALAIIKLLQQRGARIAYHDPFVPVLRAHDCELKSLDLKKDTAECFDACVIVTDHSNIDYDALCEWFSLVIDCRNATRNVKKNREKVVKA